MYGALSSIPTNAKCHADVSGTEKEGPSVVAENVTVLWPVYDRRENKKSA